MFRITTLIILVKILLRNNVTDLQVSNLCCSNLAKLQFSNFLIRADAIDIETMLSCLERLKLGQAVSIPNYDFVTHKSIEPALLVQTCLSWSNIYFCSYQSSEVVQKLIFSTQ